MKIKRNQWPLIDGTSKVGQDEGRSEPTQALCCSLPAFQRSLQLFPHRRISLRLYRKISEMFLTNVNIHQINQPAARPPPGQLRSNWRLIKLIGYWQKGGGRMTPNTWEEGSYLGPSQPETQWWRLLRNMALTSRRVTRALNQV